MVDWKKAERDKNAFYDGLNGVYNPDSWKSSSYATGKSIRDANEFYGQGKNIPSYSPTQTGSSGGYTSSGSGAGLFLLICIIGFAIIVGLSLASYEAATSYISPAERAEIAAERARTQEQHRIEAENRRLLQARQQQGYSQFLETHLGENWQEKPYTGNKHVTFTTQKLEGVKLYSAPSDDASISVTLGKSNCMIVWQKLSDDWIYVLANKAGPNDTRFLPSRGFIRTKGLPALSYAPTYNSPFTKACPYEPSESDMLKGYEAFADTRPVSGATP